MSKCRTHLAPTAWAVVAICCLRGGRDSPQAEAPAGEKKSDKPGVADQAKSILKGIFGK